MKTRSMETVSTGVLDKNKEHNLRSKDKAKKSYDVLRHNHHVSSKSCLWPVQQVPVSQLPPATFTPRPHLRLQDDLRF